MSVRDDAFEEATIPRSNGALTFDAPWQSRAHALAVSTVDALGLSWDAFRVELMRAIAQDPGRGYWDSWVIALDSLLRGLGLNGLSEVG